MTEQWNKYDKTAARRHAKPGRELRPATTTIDIHAHVGVPEAAKFVEPHLDLSTIPLAHFANAATKAFNSAFSKVMNKGDGVTINQAIQAGDAAALQGHEHDHPQIARRGEHGSHQSNRSVF